jgi:hypothetical protein
MTLENAYGGIQGAIQGVQRPQTRTLKKKGFE